MIKQKIFFHSPAPFTDDGIYLYKKEHVKRAILDLLLLNEYNFVPIFRPLPPILVNDIRDVKYKDLVTLLHKIYNYCEFHADKPCLNPELGVKVDSFGVSCNSGRFVKVTFSTYENTVIPHSCQIAYGDLSFVIDSYLDSCAGCGTIGVVSISAL